MRQKLFHLLVALVVLAPLQAGARLQPV